MVELFISFIFTICKNKHHPTALPPMQLVVVAVLSMPLSPPPPPACPPVILPPSNTRSMYVHVEGAAQYYVGPGERRRR